MFNLCTTPTAALFYHRKRITYVSVDLMPKSLLSFCSVDSAAASPQLFLPSPASLGDFIIAKFSGRCSVLTLLGFSAALDTVYYSAHFWNSFSCHSSSLISPHVLCWLGWWYVHSNIFSFLFGQVCSAWHSHVGVPQVSDSACTRRSAHLPVPSDLWMMLLACSLRQELHSQPQDSMLWAAVLPHVAPAISSAAASITSHLSHSNTVDLTDLSASCPSPPHPPPPTHTSLAFKKGRQRCFPQRRIAILLFKNLEWSTSSCSWSKKTCMIWFLIISPDSSPVI